MLTMYTNLRKKGVPAEIHIFEKGPHGVGFAQGDPVLGEYPNLLLNWLRLKGFLTGEKRVPLEGIVKVDGEALPRGTIIFHPLDKVGAAPIVGYVFNTGKVRGEFKVTADVGAVPGKYRVEVRQDAMQWLSNANNPMTAKLKLLKNGTDAQKKEVADYARARNLGFLDHRKSARLPQDPPPATPWKSSSRSRPTARTASTSKCSANSNGGQSGVARPVNCQNLQKVGVEGRA